MGTGTTAHGLTAFEAEVPLCVDLDGTLLRSDLLHESFLLLVRNDFWTALLVPIWLFGGKAYLKRRIAECVSLDAASLPYRQELIDWLHEQKRDGRRLILATASDQLIADQVAAHLGCFEDVHGSDGALNLSGDVKRDLLVQKYGARGFDYIGNSKTDLPIWKECREAVVAGASEKVAGTARGLGTVRKEFPKAQASIAPWLRALRMHQWVKNTLVFVPLITSHHISDMRLMAKDAIAFAALSLCASSIYIVNDLLDLPADREHPTKKFRPFASGALSIAEGLGLTCILLTCAVLVSLLLAPAARVVLGLYVAITLLYSLTLKRMLLLDVFTLAGLYTLRIVEGAFATSTRISPWLLSFSMFFFLSLAFAKRAAELLNLAAAKKDKAPGRGYEVRDLEPVKSFGIASGALACLIATLYITSSQAISLYKSPTALFAICPMLFFWLSRVWILTSRGRLQEDPVLFAIKDRTSYAVGFAILVILLLATHSNLPLTQLFE